MDRLQPGATIGVSVFNEMEHQEPSDRPSWNEPETWRADDAHHELRPVNASTARQCIYDIRISLSSEARGDCITSLENGLTLHAALNERKKDVPHTLSGTRMPLATEQSTRRAAWASKLARYRAQLQERIECNHWLV